MSLSNILNKVENNKKEVKNSPSNTSGKFEGEGFTFVLKKTLNHNTSKAESIQRIKAENEAIKNYLQEKELVEKNLKRTETNNFLKFRTGRRYINKFGPNKNLPVIIKDYFAPEFELNQKQREYVENTIDNDDIRLETEDVIVSNNPLGLNKYLFFNAVDRCANGLIYYSVPFLFSFLAIILNFNLNNFFENLITAIILLSFVLMVRKNFKSEEKAIIKLLYLILSLFLVVFIAYIVYEVSPTTYDKIDLTFTIKLFFFGFGVYYFGKFYVLFIKMYRQDCNPDIGNVVSCNYGAPGSGKTSNAVQEAYVLALIKWRQLQADFMDVHSREKEILKRNNPKELLDRYEIIESYKFYIMRPCIPCLWSNLEIYDSKGRRSHEVEIDHIRGLKRLPLYSVVLFDELGAVLKSQLGFEKTENYDFSDMFRLGRQFIKWTVICCEQDPSNIYIDCRRVMGKNRGFLGQEWHNKPVFLLGIYKFLNLLRTETCDKKVKRKTAYAKFLNILGNFVYSIGFRIQYLTSMGNTQTGITGKQISVNGEVFSKLTYRITPANMIVDYDDREYRWQYPSRFDKRINAELCGVGRLGERVVGFKRQFVSSTTLLDEKRYAQDYYIKKIA